MHGLSKKELGDCGVDMDVREPDARVFDVYQDCCGSWKFMEL